MLAFPTVHYHPHLLLGHTVDTQLDNVMVRTVPQVVSHQFLTKGDLGTVEYHRGISFSKHCSLLFYCLS
jgi:hypothetical protein